MAVRIHHDELLDYTAVRQKLDGHTSYLLLGNGFSSACDPVFRYPSLYEAALAAGLSERAQKVFDYLGTNNFEGVMRLLDDAHFVARTYGLITGDQSGMRDDVATVKAALVRAVAASHLAHTGEVPDEKKASALVFMQPYKIVFTTNYDLLAYWVNMSREKGPQFGDGFRPDEADPEGPSLVFSEKLGASKGMLYLHGGLHLFTSPKGALHKHSWKREGKPLMQLILESLARGQYPLFVAEGSPEKKLEQIRKNAYLFYALGKFGRIESPLVTFGHSLGSSDGHISDAIASNEDIKAIYVGLHGAEDDPRRIDTRNAAVQIAHRWGERRFKKDLDLYFYDSATAGCWG